MARINLNLSAMTAQRNLSTTNRRFGTSVERISSGLRINRAGDDAAGLTISEKLRAQVRGLNQAARNSQDAISLIQTAEGSLNEIHALLQRMRELAVQGANDTLNSIDRDSIRDEVGQLQTEIDRIANVTQFNHMKLLNGSVTFDFQIGANTDTNYEQMAISPVSVTTAVIGSGSLSGATSLSASVGGVCNLDGAARVTFLTLISSLDGAVEDVNRERAQFGAQQNRLEHTIQQLSVQAENTAASESRIRDADIAAEMSEFVRNQILQQAGVAILAQANQVPTLVLQLLR
jgi:flagellin